MKVTVLLTLCLCIMAVIHVTLSAAALEKGLVETDGTLLDRVLRSVRRYKGKWTKNEWRGEDDKGNKLYRRRKPGRKGKYGCEDENGSSSFATSDGKSDSFSNECFDD